MTDLTTMHLKCLLEKATPGPWRFSEDIADTLSGTQEIGHEVYAEERCLFGVWNDPVTDECPGNLPLAAAAPELAQEVLRMRSELESMRSAWLPLYADPECTPTEQDFAAHVVDHIDTVLRDHHE